MNNDLLKEKISHGNAMFPLEVHQTNTDVRLTERLNCHWHDELEFLVVTEGGANFHIDAGSHRVFAGEMLFVNSNRLHSATSIDDMPCGFFAVVFSPALLIGYANGSIQQKYVDPVLNTEISFPEHIKPCSEWENRILSLLSEIKDIYTQKRVAYELHITTKIYEIWYLLYSNSEHHDKNTVKNDDYRISRIKSVLKYIQKRYREKITLAELSAAFNMSEGQFCRFFKSMVKMSVVNYVNSYRINASVALLQKTDKAIGEIACTVGFNNISYFNKTFQKYMHCSPSEFRDALL